MGDSQYQRYRLPCHPPEWRTQSNNVEQQCNRLQWHDDKSGQRNCHDIGQRAVKTGFVKMKKCDRREDQFDGKPGEDKRRDRSCQTQPPCLVTPFGKPLYPRQIVQNNNRGDGRKTQLKAWPCHCFGPEQQDDERAERDQSQSQRIATQGKRGEYEQSGNAGPDRRHLGAGQ